ncbi:hypothetical protein C8R47DRAFT_1124532, partial [Mycena vitilis]
MSQPSSFQCRWNWCTVVAPTVADLLEHVREHARQTQPCCVRDIALQVRAEEGFGDSISGFTLGFSYPSTNNSNPTPKPPSIPSLPASSPVRNSPIPAIDFSLLPSSSERPVKRRRGNDSPFLSPARSNSARPPSQTPPPRDMNRTPAFLTLASPADSAQAIPNPGFPDLDTLISNSLARASKRLSTPVRTPSRQNAGSQSFSGSDDSVERHLTQDLDASFDGSVTNFNDSLPEHVLGENPYAGELNWDDESVPILPRSRSHTPSQSQSQSQSQESQSQSQSQFQSQEPQSSPSLIGRRVSPVQRRQSWYQSPRRVSNPKKAPSGAQQPSPTSN